MAVGKIENEQDLSRFIKDQINGVGALNVNAVTGLPSRLASAAPTGAIIQTVAAEAPAGWLIADGSTYDTGQYPALFALLGSNVLPDETPTSTHTPIIKT